MHWKPYIRGMIGRFCFMLFIVMFSTLQSKAEYEISGQVNLSDSWQHQIFLATIPKLDDYYNANPEDIIQVGKINEDGTFVISGNNLPLEHRYYRLYLIKKENSEFDACLYVREDDHNFIHLILDNNTKLDISTDPNHFAPFGNYDVIGDDQNMDLRNLSVLVFPSFYFYKIKFPSELQFSQEKMNRDLFAFADSSAHSLVSLAAILNTDMDKYFHVETDKYLAMEDRLKSDMPEHNYSKDYFKKMRYFGDNELVKNKIPFWGYLLVGGLIGSLFLSYLKNRKLDSLLKAKNEQTNNAQQPSLTNQEQKILAYISAGKSNKEIASELFVELSTVKTHINKLYAKLEVSNRAEAKRKAQDLTNIGV